jgi:hypothetical protein
MGQIDEVKADLARRIDLKIDEVVPVPLRHPLSQRFHDILREMGDLHDKKQLDYGRENDPFANVSGSKEWGIRPWVGAMLRANDKIKRLQKYAQAGTLANEGARDSFLDLAVYAIIGLVLWEMETGYSEVPR